MKKTIKATLLVLFAGAVTFTSCKKEDTTTGGSTSVGVTDACRITQFSVNFLGTEQTTSFVYNASKQLTQTTSNDGGKEVFTYNAAGLITAHESYTSDTLQEYFTYTYNGNLLATENTYMVNNGVKGAITSVGRYTYSGTKLVKKQNYDVDPSTNEETLTSYENYNSDAKGNITFVERYALSSSMDTTFTFSNSDTYTYGTDLSNKGLNIIMGSGIEFWNNVYMPITNVSESYAGAGQPNDVNTTTFSYTNKNAKGFPATINASLGTLNVTATATYTCP